MMITLNSIKWHYQDTRTDVFRTKVRGDVVTILWWWPAHFFPASSAMHHRIDMMLFIGSGLWGVLRRSKRNREFCQTGS